MMQKSIVVLAIATLLFASCSKKAVKPVDKPADLYVQSVELMKKKKYDDAIAGFSRIRESFPFDPIAAVAQVKQGDAYFAKKDYQAAAGTYEDFVNSYPEDENAAYALKRLGESYEKQSPTIDRDQAITLKAIERFTFLKNRYPTSPYAKDADAHLDALTQKLAAREFYVGEFYHTKGSYNASILRLEYYLHTYPAAKDREKALFYLIDNYRELRNQEKAQYYADMLRREYPRSRYAAVAARVQPAVAAKGAAPPVFPAAAPVVNSPEASVTHPAAPVANTPEAPSIGSYEETKKREIDLRPPEPPPVEEAAAVPEMAATSEENPQPAKSEAKAPSPAADSSADDAKGGIDQGKGQGGAAASGKKDPFGLSTQKNPIDVVADTMEAFEKGKTNVFKGNVIVKQEGSEPGQTLYLFSDKVTAYRNEEENEIERVDAEGNVKIVKADRTATCRQAFFYNDKHQIVLKGDVVVFEGNDRLTGDTVTYYLDEDRTQVEGQPDKRAHVTITPK